MHTDLICFFPDDINIWMPFFFFLNKRYALVVLDMVNCYSSILVHYLGVLYVKLSIPCIISVYLGLVP